VGSRVVALTGVTGFVGGAAACRLLADDSVERVLCLVRAESAQAASRRATGSLACFATPGELRAWSGRLETIAGDLTDEASLSDRRLDTATHVVHLAANTSTRSVRSVRLTNIDGALAFARRMRRAPRLERYVHVSTAYCCGVTDSRVVAEEAADPARTHLYEYTRSKAECEQLLDRTCAGLPLVIARPSVVVGHSRLGCAPSPSLFWYFRALALLGMGPLWPERAKDVVPVDYVAEALRFLLFAPSLRERTYHVSAGDRAEPWGELAQALGSPSPVRRVPVDALAKERSRFRELFGPGDDDRLLAAMEAFARFSAMGIERFDNRRLLAEGMAPPPRFSEYLPRCLSSVAGRTVHELMTDDG
jgi:nucleoside-diphosphate-sugar epimerase